MVNGKKYPYTEEGKKKAKKAAKTKEGSKAAPKITITGSTTSSRRLKPQPSPKLNRAMNQAPMSMNTQRGPKGISDMTKSPLPIMRKALEGSKKTGKGKAASTPKPMIIPKQFREMREPYVKPKGTPAPKLKAPYGGRGEADIAREMQEYRIKMGFAKRKPKALFPKKPGR
jgi:hypothetical protein